MTDPQRAPRLGARASFARRAGLLTAALSRALHLGSGSTIGGRVALTLDPRLLERLGRGRAIALVSGTNGKTTTTRLLAEALRTRSRVASSSEGANMAAGIATALGEQLGVPAVLEVDEGYLPVVAGALRPQAVVLLNLSRDQLDRMNEVRMIAQRWRDALDGSDSLVVANADDPLVVFAAEGASNLCWVAAGGLWHGDAVGCPHCAGAIDFAPDGSWSSPCGFARPAWDARLVGETLELADGRAFTLDLVLPGRFNLANAAIAALTASALGVAIEDSLGAIADVKEIAGRFATFDLGGARLRLLLAKNPAGWTELLALLAESGQRLVLAINARDADGHDPSWLWDVPFELLAGREVVATGDRWRDLAVRLRHAGLAHRTSGDQLEALALAQQRGSGPIDYLGNYTAFQEVRRRLESGARPSLIEGRERPTWRAPSTRRGPGSSALRIAVVHPDLLGTYGDGGNGRILADRARWRGVEVELLWLPSHEPLPRGVDLYCLGGGEDGPQAHAAELLRASALPAAVEEGATVFAVCAGYQILGESFPGANGATLAGLGLLEVVTERLPVPRAVGEIAVEPLALALPPGASPLSGFENHAGRSRLGDAAQPFGRVLRGVGNGADHSEGARQGKVIGTYLHGPVLARNPALADALLTLALGSALEPLDDTEEEALRSERLARGGRGSGATSRHRAARR